MSRGVFLSWAPYSRRTETLAARLDLEPVFVVSRWPKRPLTAPLKFPVQALRTIRALAARRPASIWVMDPPLPAVALAALFARRRRVPLVVDVHTVDFYDPKWRALRPLELPLLRRAAAVVVTNESLARRVSAWRCRAFVLPDPLPLVPLAVRVPGDPPRTEGAGAGDKVHDGHPAAGRAGRVDAGGDRPLLTVVATYSDDEPLELLPAVAARLPHVDLAVTGRPRGRLDDWPANLRATGFLAEEEYWRQLSRSQAVLVLTTRPDTLLSGGYEALVLGRPLVVSDHDALRAYFEDAAVFAASEPGPLAIAAEEALARGAELEGRMAALAERRAAEWDRAAARLAALVWGQP